MFSFTKTLIPAFGEEFGWRGYLLPRLLLKHSIRKTLIIQSFIWWLWHLPFLVFTGINTLLIEENILGSIIIILAVSIIPSMAHAIVFAYFWSVSSSLAVVTIYHAAFDEIRDTINHSIGLSFFTEIWQMLLLTIIGTILFSKGKWKRLQKLKNALPQFFRLIIWKFILINPFNKKKNMGTVIVTNIGMSGKFPGWIIPKSIHNLCFGVGTIIQKPWISNNAIAIRDIMQLTILFDHNTVDGSPAARFTDALVRNIESAIEL